jgi:O-antigen/teichoic acid export membrane protein
MTFARRYGFLSGLGWAGAWQLLALAIGIAVSAMAARTLGPAGVGAISFYMSLAFICSPIARWGLDLVLVRSVSDPEVDQGRLATNALSVRVLSGAVATTAILGIAWAMGRGASDIATVGLPIALSSLLGAAGVLSAMHQGLGRWNANFKLNGAAALTLLGFSACAAVSRGSPTAFAWARVAEAVALSFSSLICARGFSKRAGGAPSPVNLARLGAPFVATGLATGIYGRVDQIMVGHILSDHALGIYGIAAQLIFGWFAVGSILGNVTRPAILRAVKNPELLEDRIKTSFSIASAFGMFVLLANASFGWVVISVLFGDEFKDAYYLLLIMSPSVGLAAMGGVRTSYMLTMSQDRLYFLTTFLGACSALLLNILLIPTLGLAGAAIATVAGQFVSVIVSCLFFRDTRRVASMMVLAMFWPRYAFSPARIKNVLHSKSSDRGD